MRRALAVAATAAALAGCSAEAPQYAGFGPWRVTTTTLASATGRCDPTELADGRSGSYCFLQPRLPIGKQAADVDLYFGGTEPTAKLVELQLKVRGCRAEEIETWLRTHFGAPLSGGAATRPAFANRYLFIAAELPQPGGACLVRAFPRSEAAAFDRARAH